MTDPRHDPMSTLARAIWALVIVGFLLCVVLGAVVVKAADELPGKPITTASEAVGWALADLAALAESDRPYVRYAWVPPWGDDKWVAAIDFSTNTAASHSSVIQLGTPIANGWMVRYDLRRLAPSTKQLDTLRAVWDGLAIQDPYFHIPSVVSGVSKVIIAPHLQQQEAIAASGLSVSTGGVYRMDWLLVKMLSTLEGGKYYDFLQIPRTAKEGSTPQDDWLATYGIFQKIAESLNADQRAALFRSSVSAKARLLIILYGLGRGGNIAMITLDIADEDIAVGQHPIRNLLRFDDRAREIIVERPNGMHAFALTNDKGEFQDSAPDNVARDHTVPSPHTSRLQPAISCIRCHGPHDGWQPFNNDVATILKSKLDIFADISDKGLTREQAIDRLAGLYAGVLDAPDGPVGRARRDYSAAVYKVMGPLNPFTDSADASPVQLVSAKVSDIFGQYRYDLVTPEIACRELGLLVEPGKGVAGLDHLMGTPEPGVPVDPIAGTLRAGVGVNRSDFEAAYPDMALQVALKHGYKPQQTLTAPPVEQAPAEQPPAEEPAKVSVAPLPKPEPVTTQPVSSEASILAMHSLHNDERGKRRLRPLTLAADLSAVAQAYAEVCFDQQRIDHSFGTGRYVKDRLYAAGVPFESAAENLAWASALDSEQQTMEKWMASPGHRSAILATYTDVGFGNKGNAWVAIFATRKR